MRNTPIKGRGASSSPDPRFLAESREGFDDGWDAAPINGDDAVPPLATVVTEERARTIIARNDSPDIPFSASINPYRGCEHGCIYCYARPTHAYLDLSPGLDFETRLFAKTNAADLLRQELRKPGYRCEWISLGANTDPYQPIERRLRITRGLIEVLSETEHPFAIVTKSAMVERDIDLLAPLAGNNLVEVYISITSLDNELSRRLEPRANAPKRRVEAIRKLSAAGIPCGVMFAPVIPALNDSHLEAVLEAAASAGARYAGYVMLRLPHEIKDLFREWLERHAPLRAAHVMSLIRQIRDGRDNDAQFGSRMRGTGEFAALIERRFRRACDRLGLNKSSHDLDTSRFRPPPATGDQFSLL